MKTYKIAIVDDHKIVSDAIAQLVNSIDCCTTLFQVRNGKELITQLTVATQQPDLILLDINMPMMNGFDTAQWLKLNQPNTPFVALSMNDDDESIIKMLKLGAKGYLIKDIDTDELLLAVEQVLTKGFYYNDFISQKLVASLNQAAMSDEFNFKEKELEFIKWCCSELTYKEIAHNMNLSPKTIDGYREEVFEKIGAKSRIGIVMYAIKTGIVKL
jgi:DNA-binding NarL/FixJ family response regulator